MGFHHISNKWGKLYNHAKGVPEGGGSDFNWYVDSVNGDDANTGRSPSQAFATLGAVPTLTAGQKVGLARGSVFRGQGFNILQVANCKFAAYGTGNKPVVDCSATLSSNGWTKTTGRTNVYERTITFDVHPSGTVLVFEDDLLIPRAASAAACDAAPGSYYVTSDTAGTATLYIHATGSGDPATNNKTYDYTSKALALNAFDGENLELRDIVWQRSVYQNGPVYLGKNGRVYGCEFRQGSRHNFIARAGLLAEDCIFADAYNPLGTGCTLFVCYEGTVTSADTFILRRCAVSDANGVGTNTGYLAHQGASGRFGSMIYEDCTATDIESGWSLIQSDSITLSNCTATNVTTGMSVGEFVGTVTINDATMINVAGQGVNIGAAGTININDLACTLANNVYGSCVYCTASDAVVTIDGGVFSAGAPAYDGARGVHVYAGFAPTFTISGVRFALRRPIYMVNAPDSINTCDFNTFSAAAFLWTHQNITHTGLVDWQTTGFDANSVVS